jgi:hypothetical protein
MGWQLVPSTGTWGSDGDNGINRVLQNTTGGWRAGDPRVVPLGPRAGGVVLGLLCPSPKLSGKRGVRWRLYLGR